MVFLYLCSSMNSQSSVSTTSIPQKRPHYLALDGLRGVAALVVVWYHIFEAFAVSPLTQFVNHGYLAVDFFFLLSGFVVSYAYDNRWERMSVAKFLTRRLVRLHPMLLLGAIIGGLMFYTQSTPTQELHLVAPSLVILFTLMNALLFPSPPNWDIRGYTEIFPLNGPTWSLFFEYIANILYALILRHITTRRLGILTLCLGLCLGYEAFVHSPWNYLGAGWSFVDGGFWGGLARVCFSFTAGLWLSRAFKPASYRQGFWVCTLSLVTALVMPRLGGAEKMWLNAVYECLCVMLLFPALVWLGASDRQSHPSLHKLFGLLGSISYPLYIIHYPFIYLYIAWVRSHQLSIEQAMPMALLLFFGCIALSYILLKVYDLPIRQKLKHYVLLRGH